MNGAAARQPPPFAAAVAEAIAYKPVPCAHHWISTHEPGHSLYWVRVCSQCHAADWDNLDEQVAEVAARAAAAEREHLSAAIDAEARRLGYDVPEVYGVAWPHLAVFVADLLAAQDTS